MERLLSLAEQSLVLPLQPADLSWQQGGQEGTEDADEMEEDDEPAFGMLETVRVYAEEQLTAANELGVARRAHAHHFLAMAERADSEMRGRDQRASFLRLERERDNLRAALRWLLEREDPTEREGALRLAGALGYFWRFRGYHVEGLRWLEEALARAPQGDEADLDVRTRALLPAGVLLASQGMFDQARTRLEEGRALAEQRQDAAAMVEVLYLLGACFLYAGQVEMAIPLLEDAVRRAQKVGEPFQHFRNGMAMLFLATATFALGQREEAAARFDESLDSLRLAGEERSAGNIYFTLGAIAGQQGDLPAAVRHLRAGMEMSARLRNRWLLSFGVQSVLAVMDTYAEHADARAQVSLKGAADALREATGAGRNLWEPMPANLHSPLSEAEWEAAYREGHALSPREIVQLALRILDEGTMALP